MREPNPQVNFSFLPYLLLKKYGSGLLLAWLFLTESKLDTFFFRLTVSKSATNNLDSEIKPRTTIIQK